MGLLRHVQPDKTWLDLDDDTHRVGLDVLDAARPDPLAKSEPGLLAHLEYAHAHVVTALAGLVDRRGPRTARGCGRRCSTGTAWRCGSIARTAIATFK